jgi:TRAP-type C4-dicarboxylate transport system substrate-binding protein
MNMKKIQFVGLLAVTLLIGTAMMGWSQTPSKPIELNFAISDPGTHYEVKGVYEVWAREVEKRTGGKVKVNVYPGETLGKQVEQYDLILKGAAQLTILVGPQYPGRFPLTDVFNLPFLIPPDGPNSPGKAIRDMVHEKYLNSIYFKDVKVLWKGRYQPNVIHMAKKPVRTLNDIKGQIIGFPGGRIIPAYIKSLGASPEQSPTPEVYTNLEKGIINGQVLPFETQMAFKLYEVAKFVTMTNQGSAAKCLVMRLQTWNSMPPDVQKIIQDMNPWAEDLMYKVGEAAFQRVAGISKNAGVEIIEFSPAERARWDEATKSVEKNWFAEMDAKGLPATAMYNDIVKMKGK